MMVWARILVMVAGLMGSAGVALAAAGSQLGGGDLARLAAEFLILHAAVVLALGLATLSGVRPQKLWLVSGSAMALGVCLFSADLAFIAFMSARPLPVAAPVGGLLMIAGWLVLAVGQAFALVRREGADKDRNR